MMIWKKELSVTDVIGGITAVSTIGAVLFQLGLLGPVGASALSLLNFQDVLLGAAICIPLVIFLGIMTLLTVNMLKEAKTRSQFLVAILFPVGLIASMFAVDVFTSDIGPSIVVGALAAYSMLIAFVLSSKWTIERKVTLSIVILTTLPLGVGTYYSITSRDASRPPNATITTASSSVTGRILTMTSSYVFLIRDGKLVITPLKDVVEIERILGAR